MEKEKTRSIANNYKKLAHWNLPIESYERWLLRLFYLGWIVTKWDSFTLHFLVGRAGIGRYCFISSISIPLPFFSLIQDWFPWKIISLFPEVWRLNFFKFSSDFFWSGKFGRYFLLLREKSWLTGSTILH